MSQECQYCGTIFATKGSMERHQRTVRSCLDIQKARGVEVETETHKCSCGSIFTQKSSLKRHQAKCEHHVPPIVNVTNIGTQNNQNIQINLFGSTASSLTPELVREKVIEALSCEDVERGLARMTETAAPRCFTNERGEWLVRVADSSRNKLVLRTDAGEQPDPHGHRTTRLLKKPFIEASLIALEQTDRPKDVENTIEDIKDDEIYDKKTMGVLLRMAPAKFDEINDVFTEAHLIGEQKAFEELERVMAKRKKKEIKRLKIEAAKWRDEFLDKSQNLHDGTFWHPTYQFVIQPDSTKEFTIIGRRARREDTMLSLTKADLKTIEDMGLVSHLDEQYKVRR